MQEGQDYRGPSGKDGPEIKEIIDALRGNPMWQEFAERVIKFRIERFEVMVMAPLNNTEGAWHAERAKGSAIALRGLLELFTADLPEKRSKDDDEETQ